MRVAFAGTPEFALPALEALLAHHSVVGVLTQPDRPRGRGRAPGASPVKALAQARGLALLEPQTLRDDAALEQLRAWAVEALVVVAYGLLLPPAILALPCLGCLNIHASLLPRWRGAAPAQRAILAGDAQTGVTIMRMDEGLDTGPILLQRPYTIAPDDTGGSLLEALATLGAAALLEALAGLAAGTLRAVPQPLEGVTHAPRLQKAEARIDWTTDAHDIARQVRAFNPWPVAETRLDGEQLRIYAADARAEIETGSNIPVKYANSAKTGTIIGVQDETVLVRCGRGYLAIRSLQRPGGRVLAAPDFERGHALAGRRLG
ncbi:MAG TPA: methionyl-tRNA formyltransferase [Steroidobacteraceae bacterium]|nr:methionyl-tRNA formyltransferase [Steroidobacteraceae bacterium]